MAASAGACAAAQNKASTHMRGAGDMSRGNGHTLSRRISGAKYVGVPALSLVASFVRANPKSHTFANGTRYEISGRISKRLHYAIHACARKRARARLHKANAFVTNLCPKRAVQKNIAGLDAAQCEFSRRKMPAGSTVQTRFCGR